MPQTRKAHSLLVADLFADYQLGAAWDEMFERPGVPRPAYAAVFDVLQPLGSAELHYRAEQLGRMFTEGGVTFAHAGEDRPFPLDLIPRLIAFVHERHEMLAVVATAVVETGEYLPPAPGCDWEALTDLDLLD